MYHAGRLAPLPIFYQGGAISQTRPFTWFHDYRVPHAAKCGQGLQWTVCKWQHLEKFAPRSQGGPRNDNSCYRFESRQGFSAGSIQETRRRVEETGAVSFKYTQNGPAQAVPADHRDGPGGGAVHPRRAAARTASMVLGA